jgi:NTP pyrophosphatase (non-canonical NTP hydrolase)
MGEGSKPMMEDWISQEFIPRLKQGEFDEHLLETIASLSTEELAEVAHALRAETELKYFARQ